MPANPMCKVCSKPLPYTDWTHCQEHNPWKGLFPRDAVRARSQALLQRKEELREVRANLEACWATEAQANRVDLPQDRCDCSEPAKVGGSVICHRCLGNLPR